MINADRQILVSVLIFVMEEEEDSDNLNIQTDYSEILREFKTGLLEWLKSDIEATENEDFEDQTLDALLLKVPFIHLLTDVD